MFTPIPMVFKMSGATAFFYLLLITAKSLLQFGKCIVGKQKSLWVNKGISKSCFFKRWNFANGSSEVRNPQHFLKVPNKTLQMLLNILPKLELIFCCIQQIVHKISHVWHFYDHNYWSKHTRRMTSFFLSTLWALSFNLLQFWMSKLNFISVRYPLSSKFCSVKYTFPH